MNLDASRITPKLWQGSRPPEGPQLRRLGFDTLVLCAEGIQPPDYRFPGVRVLRAPMKDVLFVPQEVAHAAAQAVAVDVARGKRVLVTCAAGLNRSGLVSALSLWYLDQRPGVECLWHVQAARPDSLFNPVFARYLYDLPARKAA